MAFVYNTQLVLKPDMLFANLDKSLEEMYSPGALSARVTLFKDNGAFPNKHEQINVHQRLLTIQQQDNNNCFFLLPHLQTEGKC